MSKVTAALVSAGRAAVRVDRSKISIDAGLRAAVGIAIPLFVGQASGHAVAGVTAAIGALTAGFASLQGTYRSRATVIMAATAAMAACAFVGATVGHLLGVDIVVTGALGFGAGLLVCLGQSALVVGVQAVVGLVVFSQFSLTPLVALRNAGLILAGGAVQMLLVVALWPLRRFSLERRAVHDAFAELARYARAATAGGPVLVDQAAFERLDAVLADPQPFGGDEALAHRALANQADRLRLEIVSLARAGARLSAADRADASAAVTALLDTTAEALDDVAAAIGEGRIPTGWGLARDTFEQALAELRQQAEGGGGGELEALRRADALAGQLRTVLRLAAVLSGGDPSALEQTALTGRSSGRPAARTPTTKWMAERAATLRSNLALSSQACRHAIRLAVTLAAAVALSHAFALTHRYWLPMTAMIVLRPDFGSTFSRGIARVVGTLVGAGLVTVILAEWRPGRPWLSVVVIALCLLATAVIQANYAIYSVCIASLVVCLLAFTGEPDVSTAGARSLYTVIGAALALAVYVVWPTWEATSLPETLAGLMETEAGYAHDVLTAWARPESADRQALQRVRVNARLVRSNAEAAVGRWLSEPRHPGDLDTDQVLGITAAVRSFVQGVLALQAEIPEHAAVSDEIMGLADGIDQGLRMAASSLRGKREAGRLPDLRHAHVRMTHGLGLSRPGVSEPSIHDRRVALAGETDLIVNSVNTIGHLVGLAPD